MIIHRFAFLCLLLPVFALAASSESEGRKIHSVPYDIVLTHETFTFAKSADAVFPSDVAGTPEQAGLAGLGLNFYMPSGLYFGPMIYGATTGKRAGFIVMGIAGGYDLKLSSSFDLLADLYIGAGGGGRVDRGTGLEVRPAVSLNYNILKNWSIGAGYSKIAFNDSSINSGQSFVRIAVKSDFIYESYLYASHPDTKEIYSKNFSKRWRFMPLLRAVRTDGKKLITGSPQPTSANLIGAELDNFITDNLYFNFNMFAAYNGQINGYMSGTAGLGYRIPLSNIFAVDGKINVGSAGGGNVDTGGGFVTEAQAGLQVNITQYQGLRLSGGYIIPATGTFTVPYYEGGYTASFDVTDKNHRSRDMRFAVAHQRYFNYLFIGDFDFLSLQADYLWRRNFFFNAESTWSYGGPFVGTTYANALLGFGAQFGLWQHANCEIKLAGGASAGGLPQNDTIITKATLTLSQEFSNSFAAILEGGEMSTLHGYISSPFIGLGLRMQIGVPIQQVTITL